MAANHTTVFVPCMNGFSKRHFNATYHLNVNCSITGSTVTFNDLASQLPFFINDVAAAVGGVAVGEYYHLTISNPYGERESQIARRNY